VCHITACCRRARAEGCPWDESCTLAAAFQGHLHVLKWAREAGCDWTWIGCWELAEADDVRRWLLADLEARIARGEATAEEIRTADSSPWLQQHLLGDSDQSERKQPDEEEALHRQVLQVGEGAFGEAIEPEPVAAAVAALAAVAEARESRWLSLQQRQSQ